MKNITQNYTIFQAIADRGYISPSKTEKAGTWTEWHELPGTVRTRIFRKDSTNGPDDMASQLEEFGIQSENDLLEYLKSPGKLEMNNYQANDYDQLLVAYQSAMKEIERLSKPYTISFVQCGRNYIPVRIPVTDVPF